jgi:anti-sigma regulatory factor (Ser/Thr protein kinase)
VVDQPPRPPGGGHTPLSEGTQVLLQGTVEAGGLARRAIAAHDPTLSPSVRADVELLVSELVTNAVLHSGVGPDRSIGFEFRCDDGLVRVRVVDPGTDFDPPESPVKGDASGGWGLFLLDQIAHRWGVSPAPSGTCVWFEVRAAARPPSGLGEVLDRAQ